MAQQRSDVHTVAVITNIAVTKRDHRMFMAGSPFKDAGYVCGSAVADASVGVSACDQQGDHSSRARQFGQYQSAG
jgi:hypothetical protein